MCPIVEKIGHIRCKSKADLQNVRFYNVRVKFEAGKWLLKCSVKSEAVSRSQTLRNVNMRPKAIVLEDLNISGMMKNEHLAKSIAEQNLYLFRELLERKAHEAGITVIHAGRFYPSSKTCSQCGHVKAELPLSERTYKCPECGLIIDRDFNAARNLEKLAC